MIVIITMNNLAMVLIFELSNETEFLFTIWHLSWIHSFQADKILITTALYDEDEQCFTLSKHIFV